MVLELTGEAVRYINGLTYPDPNFKELSCETIPRIRDCHIDSYSSFFKLKGRHKRRRRNGARRNVRRILRRVTICFRRMAAAATILTKS